MSLARPLISKYCAWPNTSYVAGWRSYQLTDRLFQEKYGLTLEEFEAQEVVKAHDYSFEVESDHQDWDLAVDGMRTVEEQLANLRGAA